MGCERLPATSATSGLAGKAATGGKNRAFGKTDLSRSCGARIRLRPDNPQY
jgi:hypothetical protein